MNEKLPRATHQGILRIGEAELPCFVLDDGRRVISGRGMTKAIGMKGRGQGVQRISTHKTLNPYLKDDLAVAIENPIPFLGKSPRVQSPSAGYEATILVSLCEAILEARDADVLKTEQEKGTLSIAKHLLGPLLRWASLPLLMRQQAIRTIGHVKPLKLFLTSS